MKKIISVIAFLFILFFPCSVFAYENDNVTLYFFHGDGCPHCALEEEFLDSIEDKYPNLNIVRYEVWYNTENANLMNLVADNIYTGRRGVPFNVIGSTVITGFGSGTSGRIERAIEFYFENEYVDVVEQIRNGEYIPIVDDDGDDTSNEENSADGTLVVDEFTRQEMESDEALTIEVPLIGNVNLKKYLLSLLQLLLVLLMDLILVLCGFYFF